MIKRSSHNVCFPIGEDCYEIPRKAKRINGSIYQIIEAKISRGFQNIYREKALMDMTIIEFKLLTNFYLPE